MLTAALALVALPGLAGSRAPSALAPLPGDAFQPLLIPASQVRSPISIDGLDAGGASAASLTAATSLVEPGKAPKVGPKGRPVVDQPDVGSRSERKPARYTIRGQATFYDAGSTAMRLPRGTTVVICGAGGCVERVVNDYGPQRASRVVDLYRPDFFRICGCASWSGVTTVTVYVY